MLGGFVAPAGLVKATGLRLGRRVRQRTCMAIVKDVTKVVVVGGGIAGVTAANELARVEGFDVVILEASERIGGRIYSGSDDSGDGSGVFEYGATWLHGQKGNPLFAEARRLGLVEKTEDDRGGGGEASGRDDDDNDGGAWILRLKQVPHFVAGGDKIVQGDVSTAIQRHYEYMTELDVNQTARVRYRSVGEYLEQRWAEDEERSRVKASRGAELVFAGMNAIECAISGCGNLNEIGARLFHEYDELDGKNTAVPAGLSNLVRTDVPVYYGNTVSKIHWGPSGVEVATKQGALYPCKFAVVTLPLGVLKENHKAMFHPELPVRKSQAISNVSFGIVDKILMRVDHAFREKESIVHVPESDESWLRNGFISVGLNEPEAISMWLVGDRAVEMELRTDDQVCTDLLSVLVKTKLVPESTKVKSLYRSQWGTNDHFRGSYCFPGLMSSDDAPRFADIQTPLEDSTGTNRVFFAGEATHPTLYSTMTGAYLTGKTAAKQLLDAAGAQQHNAQATANNIQK